MSPAKNVPVPAANHDEQAFAGFEHPTANFIYCPNQFFEVCLRHHSRGCVRLVAYILRQTLGWLDTNGDPITQDISIPYLDLHRHAGISTRAIPRSIAEAESGGFIHCVSPGIANASGQRGQSAKYQIRWAAGDKYTKDSNVFNGFYAGEGHRTPIPNGFFDIVIPQETLVMSKVIGTVLRHTVGYQNQFGGRRSDAPLSFSYFQQFANIKDRTTLSETLKLAMKKGYICCLSEGYFDRCGGKQSRPAHYAVKWLDKAASKVNTAKTRPEKSKDGKNPTENGAITLPGEDGKNPTDTKTLPNNTSKQQHETSVVAENIDAFLLLIEAGFDKATARELSESRGFDEIQRQIEWLDQRNPRDNRLGMLRKAIEQNWAKPVTVERAEKKRRLAENARKQTTRQEIDDVKAIESKQKRIRQRDAALVIFNSMSAEEQTAIENGAFQYLNSDFYRKRFRTNKEFHLQQCLDEICRREGTVPVSLSAAT